MSRSTPPTYAPSTLPSLANDTALPAPAPRAAGSGTTPPAPAPAGSSGAAGASGGAWSSLPAFASTLPSPASAASTPPTAAPTSLYVVFRVGDGEYALAASDVLHMDAFTGATPVPGAPPFVLGVVQIRRRVVPLVDVRARFGLPPLAVAADVDPRRIIVVQAGARAVGLLVDTSREVLRIADDALAPPPDVLAWQAGGFVRAVAQLGDRVLLLVDHARVIGAEEQGGGRGDD